jgi:hypothetical protein
MLYEITVGMMYPTLSKMKSDYLPNENRGTIMNLFKIPLNIWVIVLLLSIGKILTITMLLKINMGAAFAVFLLSNFVGKNDNNKEKFN